jgi:hypothetical protein
MIVAIGESSIRLAKSEQLKKYAFAPCFSRDISLTLLFIELWVWMFQENFPDPFVVLRHPRLFDPKSKKERKWVVSSSSAFKRAKRARRMLGSTERARMPLQKLRAYYRTGKVHIMCTFLTLMCTLLTLMFTYFDNVYMSLLPSHYSYYVFFESFAELSQHLKFIT